MSKSNNDLIAPAWMTQVLKLAGVYNLLWGSWVILFPLASLKICGYDLPPTYPELWQCIGMIVGVYGIGYWIAGSDPYRHWPVILVGFLGKIFGPIGFLYGWTTGSLPLSAGIVNIFNDLIWIGPFAVILWRALKYEQIRGSESQIRLSLADALTRFKSQHGQSLADLSRDHKVMVVFLRHSGCTFCREALSELAANRSAIESQETELAIVHMDSETNGLELTRRFGLEDIHRFSDPEEQLYRAANIGLGRWNQLLSWQVLVRGFQAAILKGHGFSGVRNNVFRMPGTIILHDGKIVKRHEPHDASDHPDFCQFSQTQLT